VAIIDAQTVKAIQDAMKPVADKIGEGAGYTWEVFVRQQVAEGVARLIWAVALLLLTFAGYRLIRHGLKKMSEDKYSDWDFALIWIVPSTVAALAFSLLALTTGVMHLLNPEYYAITGLIDMVRGTGR
jgi:putative Mn2+ efflux pump MntP